MKTMRGSATLHSVTLGVTQPQGPATDGKWLSGQGQPRYDMSDRYLMELWEVGGTSAPLRDDLVNSDSVSTYSDFFLGAGVIISFHKTVEFCIFSTRRKSAEAKRAGE